MVFQRYILLLASVFYKGFHRYIILLASVFYIGKVRTVCVFIAENANRKKGVLSEDIVVSIYQDECV